MNDFRQQKSSFSDDMMILDPKRSQIVSKHFFEAKNQQKQAILVTQNRQIAPEKKRRKKKAKKGEKMQIEKSGKKSAKCVNITKGIKMYKKVQKKEKIAKK